MTDNRKAEIVQKLQVIVDKLAAFDGQLPADIYLTFPFITFDGRDTSSVDALGVALVDKTGKVEKGNSSNWQYHATEKTGGLRVDVYTYVPAAAEENLDTLRARIAELEAQVADRGEQA